MLFRKLRVVDAASPFNDQTVDIRVREDVVESIGSLDAEEGEEIFDVPGAHISPGWVDLFADYREPGYEQKETMVTGLQAAAAGGFTDVALLPNTFPAIDNSSMVQALLQKAAHSPVRVHPYGAVSKGIEGTSLAEMYDMRAHGAVAFTDGWKAVQNPMLLLKALEYVKAIDGLVVQMPVDDALAAGGLMHEGPMSTSLGMPGVPGIGETIAVQRAIELLRYTGSRLHLTGVSTAASVSAIRTAKAEGLNLTCSVAPYHLLLTDEALTDYDSVYKVNPPLRSEGDRQALIEALADRTIDAIASHHRPQEWDAKTKEFEYAADGMALQEMVFQTALQGVGAAVPLARIVDALSAAPRRILGLPLQTLQEGVAARLTIFTPDGETTFSDNMLKSRSHAHPFVGATLPGRVFQIIA